MTIVQPRGTYSDRMWSSRRPFGKDPAVLEMVKLPALNMNGLWLASHVETLSEQAPGVVELCVGAGDGTRASALELHTRSVVAVQAVFTLPVHVESAAHAAQGALPEAEKVVPASHGTTALHTMSVVAVQAVFTPPGHVEAAAHATHGALPEAE